LSIERFFKKTPPASLCFVPRGCELMTAGDQYDWQSWSQIPDYVLKLKAVGTRHANVRYDAVDFGDRGIQELVRRCKQSDPVASRLQQIFKRFKEPVVIVNHRHYWSCG
jgi:hypothetical protein